MPQLFQILRCYKCLVFQVHQTKKSNKWECKLCGEKQSIKRHYGLGTAKDCRIHVQKLNSLRGEIDILKGNLLEDENSGNEDDVAQNTKETHQPIKDSKWSNYIKEQETAEENNHENINLGDAEVVLEIPKKCRNQNTNNFKRNSKLCRTYLDHNEFQENCQNATSSDVPPIVGAISIQSKIPQSNLLSGDLTKSENYETTIRNTTQKKFIPPMLNKNSKWAQFTEVVEENEELDITPSPSIETKQKDLLFSLCDDSDLDNVLNI